jgi:predicted HTH domain antitoxin
MITTEIKFPEEIFVSVKENVSDFIKKMKVVYAVDLFKNRKLSLGNAAKLAEMHRLNFFDYLNNQKISFINWDKEEINKELEL